MEDEDLINNIIEHNKNNTPYIVPKLFCPQCKKEIVKANEAVIVVDPFRTSSKGFCKECYEKEKKTIDLERDAGLHAHRWQWTWKYWYCITCDKKVYIKEDESSFESQKPPLYLGMEKYKEIEQKKEVVVVKNVVISKPTVWDNFKSWLLKRWRKN